MEDELTVNVKMLEAVATARRVRGQLVQVVRALRNLTAVVDVKDDGTLEVTDVPAWVRAQVEAVELLDLCACIV